MQNEASDNIVNEIELLEGKLLTISAELEKLKKEARSGKKISAADLGIVVKDINRLDILMRERQDVGH